MIVRFFQFHHGIVLTKAFLIDKVLARIFQYRLIIDSIKISNWKLKCTCSTLRSRGQFSFTVFFFKTAVDIIIVRVVHEILSLHDFIDIRIFLLFIVGNQEVSYHLWCLILFCQALLDKLDVLILVLG